MEARQRHTRQTGREISNWILSLPNPLVASQMTQEKPVRTALLESFAVVTTQCSSSWKEVADQIPDIMARHVPAGQAQVFLTIIYQLLCSQYQGITTMVVALAGSLVRFGMQDWATQASLTRLLAQIILALGPSGPMLVTPSTGTWTVQQPLEEVNTRAASADMTLYTPIPPNGSVMIPKSQYPSRTIRGSSNLPIYLGNETDSRISSVDHSTQVKSMGMKWQHLTSTPKSTPKLISATWHQMAELSAK